MAVVSTLPGPFYAGEDLSFTDTLTTTVTTIAGWTISGEITRTTALADPVLCTGTVTITDPINKIVQIVALASQWGSAPQPGVYIIRIRRTDAGNNTVLSMYRFVLQPAPT